MKPVRVRKIELPDDYRWMAIRYSKGWYLLVRDNKYIPLGLRTIKSSIGKVFLGDKGSKAA